MNDLIDRQAVEHGVLGTVNVRNATLKNACIKTDCKWHTCHWSGLYENGCYMLADNSECISGEKTGFQPYRRMSDGMVRGLREYFKEYKGCKNCKHQPEPLQMCDYGKRRQYVELICSGWEKKDG